MPTIKQLPRAEWVEVTPYMAHKWLQNNKVNRPLRKSVIERYAFMLSNGGWDLTHQGIAFGKNDALLDGQHRLSAIVLTKKAVCLQVNFGLPYESGLMLNIDRGLMRSNSVILGEDAKVVQIANYLTKVVYGSASPKIANRVSEILDVFKPFIEELLASCPTCVKTRSSVPVKAAVCIRSIQTKDVLYQYRKFVLMEFENMWPSVIGFFKQCQNGYNFIGNDWQNIVAARAWVAFNPEKKLVTKIQIKDIDHVFNNFKNQIKELI